MCRSFRDAVQRPRSVAARLHVGRFRRIDQKRQIDSRYPAWFEKHRADEAVLRVQRETVLESAPVFSIVVPLYKTPRRFFDEMVLSVRAQDVRPVGADLGQR